MESMDMGNEQKPKRKVLFKEGLRRFLIVGCSEEVRSKAGNKQYILTIKDTETGQEDSLYAVSEPGKRWMLKEILNACKIKNENGVYQFEPPLSENLIGKVIMGLVEHEPNTFINRENVTITTTQHKIYDFKPEDQVVEWDKDL